MKNSVKASLDGMPSMAVLLDTSTTAPTSDTQSSETGSNRNGPSRSDVIEGTPPNNKRRRRVFDSCVDSDLHGTMADYILEPCRVLCC